MLRISVIIRFRNEAAYLEPVLAAVRAQEFPRGRICLIGVDNRSTDASPAIAERYCDRVLGIGTYFPGAAVNLAMRTVPCDYAAVLSAHTVPASPHWLASLVREAEKPDSLGVYGAQIYPYYSVFLDKRDLSIFSTARPRIETRDSDLWNANSMIPRRSWEAAPFDETVFELEDHYWTKCALDGTNCVRFAPDAIVYHYSHDVRNDRHLPRHLLEHPEAQLKAALATLADPRAGWPELMMAALTVKTLRADPRAARALPDLIRLLAEHWDFDLRWRVADTLGVMPTPEGMDALITGLADPNYYARNECAWAIARIGGEAANRLRGRLDHVPRREWPLAAVALGRSGDGPAQARAVELVRAGLAGALGELRKAYVFAAGELAALAGAPALLGLLDGLEEDPDEETRAAAAWAAGELGPGAADPAAARRLVSAFRHDPSAMVRAEAAVAAGKLALGGRDGGVPDLEALGRDPAGRVRYSAVQMAGAMARNGLDVPDVAPDPEDEDFGVRLEVDRLRATRGPARATQAAGAPA